MGIKIYPIKSKKICLNYPLYVQNPFRQQ